MLPLLSPALPLCLEVIPKLQLSAFLDIPIPSISRILGLLG